MAGCNIALLKALLVSTSMLTCGAALAQGLQQDPRPEQEQASETAAEGDADTQERSGVPTTSEPTPDEAEDLESIIVTGQIGLRNRTETVAPELTYGQEFFQDFEPTSVGDSLKRVPGVAFGSDIGEYDSPALRGLAEGFTQILVNGRPIPGAGNDRTVFVDRIPAEIIDRIEVIRSPSADIDSQGIGGTINIILKDGTSLPPGVIARAGLLYYPDGDDTIRGSGAVSASGRNEDESFSYSVTIDAQQRYNPKITREEVFNDDVPGFDDTETGLELFNPFDRDASIAPERVEESDTRRSFDFSINADATFRLAPEHQLRFDGFFIRTRRRDTELTLALERDDIEDEFEIDAIEISEEPFRQENFGLSALYEGTIAENLTAESQLRFSQFRERTGTDLFEVDDDLVEDLDDFTTEDIPGIGPGELVETDDIDARDSELSFDASLRWVFGGGHSLKAGFFARHKNRDFSQITLEDLDEDEPTDVTEGSGAFEFRERRLDGFIVAEWQLASEVTLQTGLRSEYTRSRQILPTPNEFGETEARDSVYHLNPSAHLQAGLTDGLQLRASIARTVRRPAINQLVPFVDREAPEDDDVTIGNPDLAFETAWGIDVGVEQELPGRGIAGINFFHRWVDNLIGLVNTGVPADPDDPDNGGNVFTFENTGSGKVYGIEFDLSTTLGFIGLEETGLFVNYTRIWSNRIDGSTGLRVPFNGQPSYIYNFGLTQDIPTLAASFGFSYRKQGRARSTFFGEEEFQEYGGNLEVFIEKRVGRNFVLRLTGNNLLDARSLQWERNFDGDTGAEILENQIAGNVDAFEVEHEETSPQVTLTARVVF